MVRFAEPVTEQAFHLYEICGKRGRYFPSMLLDMHTAVEHKEM